MGGDFESGRCVFCWFQLWFRLLKHPSQTNVMLKLYSYSLYSFVERSHTMFLYPKTWGRAWYAFVCFVLITSLFQVQALFRIIDYSFLITLLTKQDVAHSLCLLWFSKWLKIFLFLNKEKKFNKPSWPQCTFFLVKLEEGNLSIQHLFMLFEQCNALYTWNHCIVW